MYGEQKGYFARTAYTLLAVLYIGKLLTYFVFIRQIAGNGHVADVLRDRDDRADRHVRHARRHEHRAPPADEDLAEENRSRVRSARWPS